MFRSLEQTDVLKNTIKEKTMLLSSSSMNREAYRKPEGMPSSVDKEWMRSERELSRSTPNSNQLHSKTRLAERSDSPITMKNNKSSKTSPASHRSSKNSNKNQRSSSNNEM